MPSSPTMAEEIPNLTLPQALNALAHAHRALTILDKAYATLNQRLNTHLERAQYLSEALAVERAHRLALQARLRAYERELPGYTASQSLLRERAVGDR